MPDRWITLIADDLKAAGYGTILASAQATPVGDVDPVVDVLASATARVRRAVSAGNAVDTDVSKIPRSLKSVGVRMAIYALMELIGLSLSEDQRETRKLDMKDLTDLATRQIRVEEPDHADAAAVPQNRGSWNSENQVLGRMHPTPSPSRQFPNAAGQYANPDAPANT